MKELLLVYFAAEKRDGILALSGGLVALLASSWLVATRHPSLSRSRRDVISGSPLAWDASSRRHRC